MKRLMHKGPFLPYTVALIVTLLAVAIRWLLNPLLGNTLIFVTIYGAVAYTSWFGGYRPTILTTLLGYILCNYLFIEPRFTMHFNPAQTIGFIAYCITCGIMIALGEVTRNAEKRLLNKEAERQKVEEELRESEHKIRVILESITDSFYTLDADWRFSYVNPAAETALGKKARDILNKVKWEVFPEAVGGEIETLYRKVMDRKVSSTVTTYYAPHEKWYEIRAYPTGSGLSIYFRDVSRRIEAEQQLKQQSAELAEMDKRKNEFLATLAHELRNPLAPIRNSLSIMELKGHDATTVEKARAVIERQVVQMVRLVDDLMDVSRISHGKLELQRANVALSSIIQSAVESSRPIIEAAKLELIVNIPVEPIVIYADLTRLAQVFLNLLNNAAKFTDPGGKVTLNVSQEQESAGGHKTVVVTVSDTGIGISSKDLPKIFDAFTQLSNSLKRSHGGLGVGLMLVRRIVEMHNGTVQAFSDGPGMGTTFTVRLPLMAKIEPLSSHNYKQLPDDEVTSKLRILIVDDNRDAATSLASYMEAMGHETFVVHDGISALEAAESHQPEAIFLDIGMPGLNGYEVATYIRKQDWGKTIKLFAVTGWGQEEDRLKSSIAGFDAHLVKPVDPKRLTDLLLYIMGNK